MSSPEKPGRVILRLQHEVQTLRGLVTTLTEEVHNLDEMLPKEVAAAYERGRHDAFVEYATTHLEWHYAGDDEDVPTVAHADWCPVCRAEKAEAELASVLEEKVQ